MKQRIYFLKPLSIAAFLLPIPAYAGCTDYNNSPAQERPRAILCYKGKCDDTTVDTVCGNSSRINFQYANGLTVFRAEGKNQAPEFSNTLGRKMNAKDWTCKTVGKTGGIDACALFKLRTLRQRAANPVSRLRCPTIRQVSFLPLSSWTARIRPSSMMAPRAG